MSKDRAMLTHRRRAGWTGRPGSGVCPVRKRRLRCRCGWRSHPRPDVGGHKARSLTVCSLPGDRNTVHGGCHGGSRHCRLGLAAVVPFDLAVLCDNGLPRAALVAVRVRVSSRVVGHLERFQVHGVRATTVVCFTTGPFCTSGLASGNRDSKRYRV